MYDARHFFYAESAIVDCEIKLGNGVDGSGIFTMGDWLKDWRMFGGFWIGQGEESKCLQNFHRQYQKKRKR